VPHYKPMGFAAIETKPAQPYDTRSPTTKAKSRLRNEIVIIRDENDLWILAAFLKSIRVIDRIMTHKRQNDEAA